MTWRSSLRRGALTICYDLGSQEVEQKSASLFYKGPQRENPAYFVGHVFCLPLTAAIGAVGQEDLQVVINKWAWLQLCARKILFTKQVVEYPWPMALLPVDP